MVKVKATMDITFLRPPGLAVEGAENFLYLSWRKLKQQSDLSGLYQEINFNGYCHHQAYLRVARLTTLGWNKKPGLNTESPTRNSWWILSLLLYVYFNMFLSLFIQAFLWFC